MSAQRFCHHCGHQVVIGSKFCPDCGTNLLSLSSSPPAPPTPARPTFTPFQVAKDDDDDSYIDKIDHLDIKQNQLFVEITSHKPALETLGSAVIVGAQLGVKPGTVESRPGYQNVDTKQFEQEFQKEAGAIRPDSRTHVIKNNEK